MKGVTVGEREASEEEEALARVSMRPARRGRSRLRMTLEPLLGSTALSRADVSRKTSSELSVRVRGSFSRADVCGAKGGILNLKRARCTVSERNAPEEVVKEALARLELRRTPHS